MQFHAPARRRLAAVLVAIALVAAACAGGDDGAPDPGLWRTAVLRDVLSGEEFRIADFAGKVVAVETMAVWCVNCRIQQDEVKVALDRLATDDVVFVSLGVDPNERAEDLETYARQAGFDWRFAIAPAEVSRSLAAAFGDQILSPPATPVVFLGPDGTVIEKHIGILGAADLEALVRPHVP